jgi:hypothetical protein
MRHRWLLLAAIVGASLSAGSACAQTTEKKAFEGKMYSIETVSHFGIAADRFAAMTEAQRRSLVEARNDLMPMLQAIQHKRDVMRYASREMVGKYGTSAAIAASVIEAETSILAVGLSDFALVDKRTIKLNFFAVLSSEGNILVSEKTAVLKQTDSGWRVAAFE